MSIATSPSTATMYTNFQLSHDPPQRRLRQLLCNEYIVGAPHWQKALVASTVLATMVLMAVVTVPSPMPYYNVAFIGNSMMYYNDFPRFMESLSDGHLTQDCCLHGDADLNTILTWGSGTYQIWHTGVARMDEPANDETEEQQDDDLYADDAYNASKSSWYGYTYTNSNNRILYDMGACTVEQLLFGTDPDLDIKMENYRQENYFDDDEANNNNNNNNNHNSKDNGDDFFEYDDGKNPCLKDPSYYAYRQERYAQRGPPKYNFIVINDRTRTPARLGPRNASLQVLEETYVPWFQETGATPVFLATYGYDTPYRDMSGLVDVPTFTSLTYEGYKEYAALVKEYLPPEQEPRLSPVGLAFLMVWEENFSLWQKLFHIDQIHASPHGTFLQGCVVHHTLFGRLPAKRVALRNDMSALWDHARRMQPRKHRRLPMPTLEEAEYLYHVAERVTVRKQFPNSFIHYYNNEASDYIPNDGAYADNDIY